MDQQARRERLQRDLAALESLRQASPILDFAAQGTPPDRYTIVFHGRGLHRPLKPGSEVEVVEEHRCELRLPYAYPRRAPQVRWLTPLFHPNVSFSGFISLRDIGLPWDSDVGLDVVCERLWDVARMAFMNLDRAANFAAKGYFQQGRGPRLPVDDRPLRGVVFPDSANIVRYQRRGANPATPSRPAPRQGAAEVLFIGEDTPPPPLMPPRAAKSRGRDDDDEVLYIGDE